jgi:hypothetical protein
VNKNYLLLTGIIERFITHRNYREVYYLDILTWIQANRLRNYKNVSIPDFLDAKHGTRGHHSQKNISH